MSSLSLAQFSFCLFSNQIEVCCKCVKRSCSMVGWMVGRSVGSGLVCVCYSNLPRPMRSSEIIRFTSFLRVIESFIMQHRLFYSISVHLFPFRSSLCSFSFGIFLGLNLHQRKGLIAIQLHLVLDVKMRRWVNFGIHQQMIHLIIHSNILEMWMMSSRLLCSHQVMQLHTQT